MPKLPRLLKVGGTVVAVLSFLFVFAPGTTVFWTTHASAQADDAAEPEPAPPADQGYTGSKRCSSCHFTQYTSWKDTKHANAFNNLPAKYKRGADARCFGCHITGYGHPKGYTGAATVDLLGVTCEACHGPGSEHERICKQFAEATKLTPEQEKQARDSIWKMKPGNTCANCHLLQGHKEHLEYDKEE